MGNAHIITCGEEEAMAEATCPICGKPCEQRDFDGSDIRAVLFRAIRCAKCGDYYITAEACEDVGARSDLERAMLAAVTRERTEERLPTRLLPSDRLASGGQEGYTIREALDLFPHLIPDRLNRAVLNLARRSRCPGDRLDMMNVDVVPLLFGEDSNAARFMLDHLANSGLVDVDKFEGSYYACWLTAAGWERAQKLQGPGSQASQVFVAMWFDDSLDEVYTDGIAPAVREAGYSPRRVKEDIFDEKICDYIVKQIRSSHFLVADVTQHREAVYFEAGYAMGLGLPVIWSCRRADIDDCCFDTRQYKHILWDTAADLRRDLANAIEATIPPPRR